MGQETSLIQIFGLIVSCFMFGYSFYATNKATKALKHNYDSHKDLNIKPKIIFSFWDLVVLLVSMIVVVGSFATFEELPMITNFIVDKIDNVSLAIIVVGTTASMLCNVFFMDNAKLVLFGDMGIVAAIVWLYTISSVKYITAFFGA